MKATITEVNTPPSEGVLTMRQLREGEGRVGLWESEGVKGANRHLVIERATNKQAAVLRISTNDRSISHSTMDDGYNMQYVSPCDIIIQLKS